jgi:hypothetical protein
MIDHKKLLSAMDAISEEKGPFDLFGLFLREDATNRWDLVVSAPWIEDGRLKSFSELVALLAKHIGKKEMKELSRVVSVNADDPALAAVTRAFSIERGTIEVKDSMLFGMLVKHAFIFRAQRPSRKQSAT